MAKLFTITGQRPMTIIAGSGMPKAIVEIVFEWGTGFVGTIQVDQQTATPEAIRTAILDHIKRFSIDES